MNRRFFLKTSASVLAASFLSQQTYAKKDLLVKYGGSAWLAHYPAYLAMTEGLLAKHQLSQDYQSFGTSSARMSALISGNIDIASTGAVSALALMARGVKHFSIIAIPESFGKVEGIVARPGITSIEQLKGKKIGVTFASSSQLLVLDILAQHGMTPDDVVLLNVPAPELPSALKSGQIDASATWTPYFEHTLKQEGTTLLADDTQFKLYQSHNVPPGPDVLVVRNSFAKKYPEQLKAYLSAYFEANTLLRETPEKVAEKLSKLTNLSTEEQLSILKGTDWFSLPQQKELLTGKYAEGVQLLADLLVQHKQIDKSPNVKEWIDTSFI